MVDEIPSCPMNMVRIKKSWVPMFNIGVTPADRPVVPKAEATSKKMSVKFISSLGTLPHMVSNDVMAIKETMTTIIMEIIKTKNEEITVSFGILRLKILMSLLPLNFDQTAKIIIAKVVVRIPPAVDEGAEPMNIITEKIISEVWVKNCKLVVANPAFLVEKEWKMMAIIRSPLDPKGEKPLTNSVRFQIPFDDATSKVVVNKKPIRKILK